MKLSIVIATHRRADSLKKLLESLSTQFDPNRHELFVAENGTSAPLTLSLPFAATHLHDPRPGKCRIQNRALEAALGEIIVFLDDDLTVAKHYLAAVEEFFDTHPEYAAMKGRVLPASDPSVVGDLAPYLGLPLVDEGDRVRDVHGVIGANMAFRAEALRQVGHFDERLGPGAAGHEEETEMSQRLRRYGYRIGYAPAAIVYHEVDPSRASRQRFIRIARERGYCRALHEHHHRTKTRFTIVLAAARLFAARLLRASPKRIAREEERLATAQGIMDGLGAGGRTQQR